jgi:membrane-associated phospholipid phosphatase
MAGAGATIGGLVAFSMLFGYNPVWWLCAMIFVTGVVGSARIVLGHHSLGEVLVGFVVGLGCSFMVLHPFYNDLVRFLLF